MKQRLQLNSQKSSKTNNMINTNYKSNAIPNTTISVFDIPNYANYSSMYPMYC
jgi:hypothetical protein